MPGHSRLIVLFLCCIAFACSGRKDSAFRDQFRWLAGKWEGKNGDALLVEHWMWNKYRYEGFGYEINNSGDTTFREQLFLEEYAGVPSYVAVIPGQGPTLFAGQAGTDNDWLFINGEHDFPSRIRYRLDADSTISISLMSRIEPLRPALSYQLNRTK